MKGAARLIVSADAGAMAAVTARAAYTALRRHPPGEAKTWSRTNHRGERVTLLEGPAVTAGAVTGQVLAAVAAARRTAFRAPVPDQPELPYQPERRRVPLGRGDLALAAAGLGGVAFGMLDDLRGSGKRRGLRGHLGALAHGEVTTGTVKLAGLAATGLTTALLEGGDPLDVAINAGLVAGGANLLNLFDLRPGRAIKVAALAAAGIAVAPARSAGARLTGLQAVAAPAGAALALLPEDLGEQAMLGDAGANALGAMLGAAAAQALPRGARARVLLGIVALTVASEKVSFTKVIAATPPLNWLDMLGRRPPSTTASGQALADLIPAQAGRRHPGRHRRNETRERRSRSGSWFSAFFKSVTRREP